MKTRAFVLLVFATSVTALTACFDEPTCPYGEVLVHDGRHGSEGTCVRRSYVSTPASSATPSKGTESPAAPATPASGAVGGDKPPGVDPIPGSAPPPTGAGMCGGLAAHGGSVRVVDKSDSPPALSDAPLNLADGSYALVQATFFRAGPSASPVRSLEAALDVRGPTLTVNAHDTSFAGLPDESLTFLLASGGMVTKTCESVHGSVSAWFFPFIVGAATQAQLQYDAASGFVRLIVSRADGKTELIFAR